MKIYKKMKVFFKKIKSYFNKIGYVLFLNKILNQPHNYLFRFFLLVG